MNILLDESAPHVIKKRLPALAIRTVQEMGWAGFRNGELLKLAEMQFDVFITADKKPSFSAESFGTKTGRHPFTHEPGSYYLGDNSNA